MEDGGDFNISLCEGSELRKERLVIPGEKLGVIEEFVPGENVYVNGRGALRSATLGVLKIFKNRVDVSPLRSLEIPLKVGELVLAEVWTSETARFIVKIVAKWSPFVLLTNPITGWIMKEEEENRLIRVGDLILAKVGSTLYNQVILTIAGDKSLGVLYAKCLKCSVPLKKLGNTLVCPICESIHLDRKISPYYGTNPFIKGA